MRSAVRSVPGAGPSPRPRLRGFAPRLALPGFAGFPLPTLRFGSREITLGLVSASLRSTEWRDWDGLPPCLPTLYHFQAIPQLGLPLGLQASVWKSVEAVLAVQGGNPEDREPGLASWTVLGVRVPATPADAWSAASVAQKVGVVAEAGAGPGDPAGDQTSGGEEADQAQCPGRHLLGPGAG